MDVNALIEAGKLAELAELKIRDALLRNLQTELHGLGQEFQGLVGNSCDALHTDAKNLKFKMIREAKGTLDADAEKRIAQITADEGNGHVHNILAEASTTLNSFTSLLQSQHTSIQGSLWPDCPISSDKYDQALAAVRKTWRVLEDVFIKDRISTNRPEWEKMVALCPEGYHPAEFLCNPKAAQALLENARAATGDARVRPETLGLLEQLPGQLVDHLKALTEARRTHAVAQAVAVSDPIPPISAADHWANRAYVALYGVPELPTALAGEKLHTPDNRKLRALRQQVQALSLPEFNAALDDTASPLFKGLTDFERGVSGRVLRKGVPPGDGLSTEVREAAIRYLEQVVGTSMTPTRAVSSGSVAGYAQELAPAGEAIEHSAALTQTPGWQKIIAKPTTIGADGKGALSM